MKINVFRTRFQRPANGGSIGVPCDLENDLLPLLPKVKDRPAEEDGSDGVEYYEVISAEDGSRLAEKGREADDGSPESCQLIAYTYDRGDPGNLKPQFYQLVFQVEPKPEDPNDVHMSFISERLSFESKRDDHNPLKYHEENDLWYQETSFDKRGRPDNKKKVATINTAGLHTVVAKNIRSGEVAEARIQVHPSVFSMEEYQYMLDRLLDSHSKLVVDRDSSVGIGAREKGLEFDVKLWRKLKPEILSIMRMRAILQEKRYAQMPAHKLRHFDNRVIRSYAASGGTMCEGVGFSDVYDIRENRLIKRLMKQLLRFVFYDRRKVEAIPDDGQIEEWVEERTREDLIAAYGRRATERYLEFPEAEKPPAASVGFSVINPDDKKKLENKKSRDCHVYLERSGEDYEIRTYPLNSSNNPFANDNQDKCPYTFYPLKDGDRLCGLCLRTRSMYVALDAVHALCRILDGIKSERGEQRRLGIDYTGELEVSTRYDKYRLNADVDFRRLTGVTALRIAPGGRPARAGAGAGGVPETSPVDAYLADASECAALVDVYLPNSCVYDSLIGIIRFAAQKRLEYRKQYRAIQIRKEAAEVREEIEAMLCDPWFGQISDTGVGKLEMTPLFAHNPHYRIVYDILCRISRDHPVLAAAFEENRYGVRVLHEIYEYWVFYELLQRFKNLGFRAIDKDRLNRDLNEMLESYLSNTEGPEGFIVCMRRAILQSGGYIEVMFGFNCEIGDAKAAEKRDYSKYLLPDYFIRVTREDGYHWYFLDAKCQVFTEKKLYERTQNSGVQKSSVVDVCYDKYTARMGKDDNALIRQFEEGQAPRHPDFWKDGLRGKHTIEGAYLIVAEYDNGGDSPEEISINDRLCGRKSHGMSLDREKSPSFSLSSKPPSFSLGSIVFRPDREDELTTLLEMIFEYKEGAMTVDRGQSEPFVEDVFELTCQARDIHVMMDVERRPKTLQLCWNSSADHTESGEPDLVQITPMQTTGENYKFKVHCPCCDAHRWENYCNNSRCRCELIKHEKGNYLPAAYRDSKGNFLCPNCGAGIKQEQ